jgi:DNA mismatch repair protein MutL
LGQIHVLDKHTAELIAAGEVVERPSSVIKELLENTVDAGATVVTVEIRNGGITYMRITDNGCGIAKEDVPTAFLRHATSKVRTEMDLEHIGTLGFRGEALASIAAVADVQIATCTDESGQGTAYRIVGGEEREFDEVGAPKGTTITVSDLFFNVPARMKFLKKDVSEGNAVAAVVQRIALSHPEISFRFLRDGRQEMLTPGDGKLFSCVYAVLGKDFANNAVSVDYTLDGVHVSGFVCKPSATRANRTMQHFFINGRYVKTSTAAVALERAYHGMIMVGRFPTCVLHLELPPEAVDVNVHPAKIEVRFVNEKPVFDAVYHGVRSALQAENDPSPAPTHAATTRQAESAFLRKDVPQKAAVQTVFSAFSKPTVTATDAPKAPLFTKPVSAASVSLRDDTAVARPSIDILVDDEPPQPIAVQPVTPKEPPQPAAPQREEPADVPVTETAFTPPRILGELFSTYILAEHEDTLLVIDKHAAHERILYNDLKKKVQETASQMLLEPVAVALSADAANAVLEELPLLQKAGYILEDFGNMTVLVRAVPTVLAGCDVASVIEEIAGGFISGRRDALTAKEDWLYHSIACRAAIKAGDTTTQKELQMLTERVLTDPDVRFCPHGRPVSFTMTKKELEKQFGRIQ